MPTKQRKAPKRTSPLLRTPLRIGTLDAPAVIGELRDIHEKAEDPDVGAMPADDEVYRALLYTETHAAALKITSDDVRRSAAIKRVMLWEYLREQAEIHQVKAIEAARGANAEWTQLAPALAVSGKSGAYQKAKRLKAVTLTDESLNGRTLRRTPEAVLAAESRIAARDAEQQRAQKTAQRRHDALMPVAHHLIEHRAGLPDSGNVTYWLDEVAAVLPHCETPTQIVSLRTYVAAVVRELRKVELQEPRPIATTDSARLAYAAAAELFPS
ncbi:hypothetical protein [Streptomyces sp. IB201691-2A2]|uniref:hypothetical protein n=1 Tax=Streptomyces sp. IB201691-2A2 TaxID=2561920 RepID=UPI0021B0DD26|nr:hypothetical protein [Streptomyces sp. IB201691-2A2]